MMLMMLLVMGYLHLENHHYPSSLFIFHVELESQSVMYGPLALVIPKSKSVQAQPVIS
jgi:hypothetical protein